MPDHHPAPDPATGAEERELLARIVEQLAVPFDVRERRYYLAHHPEAAVAVLRFKTPVEAEAWRGRRWQLFPSAPTIEDVTCAALALMEAILAWPLAERHALELSAVIDTTAIHLEARAPADEASPGAVPLWRPQRAQGYHIVGHDDATDLPVPGIVAMPFEPHRLYVSDARAARLFGDAAGARCCRWAERPDGVTGAPPRALRQRHHHGKDEPVLVEAGERFAAGANLASDDHGRAVAVRGDYMRNELKALDAATAAGDIVRATWWSRTQRRIRQSSHL